MGTPKPAPLPDAVVYTKQNEPYEGACKLDERSVPLVKATPVLEPIPSDVWTYENTDASVRPWMIVSIDT